MNNTKLVGKEYVFIYLYGLITMLSGLFLFYSEGLDFQTVKLILGISLVVGALFAFLSSLAQPRKHVQFAYHEMHALAMLAYGVAVLFFSQTFETLVSFTSFLMIFYAFSEIIFCIWLFNLLENVHYKIIFLRLFVGLGIGVGTVIALHFDAFTLKLQGILFVLVGIHVLLYVPVMKGTITSRFSNQLAP